MKSICGYGAEGECWRHIDCPTLVTRGDRSDVFADETLQRMGQEIGDCKTVTISNAGHLVQGDTRRTSWQRRGRTWTARRGCRLKFRLTNSQETRLSFGKLRINGFSFF